MDDDEHRNVDQFHEVPQESHNGESYSDGSADLEVFCGRRQSRGKERDQLGSREGGVGEGACW